MKFSGTTAHARLGGFFTNSVAVVPAFDTLVFTDGDGFFLVASSISSASDRLPSLRNCFAFLRSSRAALIAALSAAMLSRRLCSSETSLGSFNESSRPTARFSLYIARNCSVIAICAAIASPSVFAAIRRLNVSEILSSLTGGIACSYSSAALPSMRTADFAGSTTLNSSPS